MPLVQPRRRSRRVHPRPGRSDARLAVRALASAGRDRRRRPARRNLRTSTLAISRRRSRPAPFAAARTSTSSAATARLVSFTYEDHVLASLREVGQLNADLNQRNVAVALPRRVRVPRTHPRNHDGEFFSVVVTRTVNAPRPGSDEISRAYEEAWLATPQRAGSSSTPASAAHSLAFLGDVIAPNGTTHPELFLVELPADLTQPGDAPLEGTPTRRPAPPAGTQQRRLTFTSDRPSPGLQGPRFWPRSAPDGSLIAFLMPDDAEAASALDDLTPRRRTAANHARRVPHCERLHLEPRRLADRLHRRRQRDGSRSRYETHASTDTVDAGTASRSLCFFARWRKDRLRETGRFRPRAAQPDLHC